MSTVTLQNLLDYPYSFEEIHARIAQSELDSSQGRVYEFDDVIREIEEFYK